MFGSQAQNNSDPSIHGRVRFRADPKSVRVSVKRSGDGLYTAYVQRRGHASEWTCGCHRLAYRAVVIALRMASDAGMPGIDLHMQWSHVHPWWGRA